MMSAKRIAMMSMILAVAMMAGNARALDVSANITTDTTWTKADNPVVLKGPVFLLNEATLTIEAGVIVVTFAADDGGLVVTRDSQIFIQGTKDEPVIMTSANDVGTWDGSVVTPTDAPLGPDGLDGTDDDNGPVTAITTIGDPTAGVWREAANEWRNLTILGNGVISASEFDGAAIGPATDGDATNPTVVDGTAQKIMEGLNAADAGGDTDNVRYGGADDDEDNGVINYLSMRYTGRVIGTGDELNGLALGGLGQATDIENVDIMNNVDDGIEVWGGKVNLKKVNIWNIGDDSFDFDQGWRGKAQFGLIVQGYSFDGPKQGGGTGDNIFEHDGGEQSNVQPTTTAVIQNFTAVGFPNGDGATTWRDNVRVQYRKCLFIDFGEELVRFDGTDGDGGKGYPDVDGNLPATPGGSESFDNFEALWTTSYDTYPAYNVGSGDFAPTADFYSAQVDGNLCEIRDSVIYQFDSSWTPDGDDRAVDVGVVGAGFTSTESGGSPVEPFNVVASSAPIADLQRGPSVNRSGVDVEPVVSIDPTPQNDALNSELGDPVDPFFTPTSYRGAFSPDHIWIKGWTAADAFGFLDAATTAVDDPDEDAQLNFIVNWTAEVGKKYVVESSDDGRTWTPEAVVTADEVDESYDTGEVAGTVKVFRVLPL